MKILNRTHFKLPAHPWQTAQTTADGKRVATLIRAAVQAREFVSILGPRGSGKSVAVQSALRSHPVKVVEPLRLTRDKLHMGDIETALIRELSDERPRRSGEARSHQVRRILGSAAQQQDIVLVIDDAHVLHGQTLRSLKRLREMSWLGKSPLLGIILIGQKDKTQGIDEVRLRSDQLWLAGLTAREIRAALHSATGKLLDTPAVEAVVTSGLSANWLDLQALIDACLAEAKARGDKRISAGCVKAVLNPKPTASGVAAPQVDDGAVSAYLTGKLNGKRQVA